VKGKVFNTFTYSQRSVNMHL